MIRILIVENGADWIDVWNDKLRQFKHEMVYEFATTVAAAKDKLQDSHYDIAFIDLMLNLGEKVPASPLYEGIELGAEVRQQSSSTVVVLYSTAIEMGHEHEFAHYEECKKAEPDAILSRQYLLSGLGASLRDYMLRWIKNRKTEQLNRRPITWANDWPTKALIESVGESVIGAILEDLIPDMTQDHVSAISPGFSGAIVARVESSNTTHPVTLKNIVKFSKSQYALNDELLRRPPMGSAFGFVSVVPSNQNIANAGDWHAIAVPEIQGAIPLRHFLLESPSTKTAQTTLNKMISELLVRPASQSKSLKAYPNLQLTAVTGSDILTVISEICTWKGLIGWRDAKQQSVVRHVVEELIFGNWSLGDNSGYALLHGDFHCRNVFVSKGKTPLLIDFGRSEVYPRLFDFAALNADLIFSVVDSKDGADLVFGKSVQRWLAFALKQFPFTSQSCTLNARDNLLTYLRSELLNQMTKYLPSVTELEYAKVLLFHTLRYLRFPTTSPPKKLLAAHFASELIRRFDMQP